MKTANTRSNLVKPLGIALAGGAFMITPLLGAIETAQAKPPAHAPAHGYYRNKNKDKVRGPQNRGDRDHDWDRDGNYDRYPDYDRDRFPDYNRVPDYRNPSNRIPDYRTPDYRIPDYRIPDSNRGATTLNGVVLRNPFGDKFELRADNGRTYVVEFYDVRQRPSGLSQGDRVAVYGDVQGTNIAARNVRILNNR